MEDIKECTCETTAALISQDNARLLAAIRSHVDHACPNYSLALHHLVANYRNDTLVKV